jgi:branched-chain amino acid transport system permease protein
MADRRATFITLGVLLVLAIALPFAAKALGQPALITLATRMLIYAIAAVSLDLILGYGGLVSFGHAAFYGVGGYVAGILFFHDRSGEPLLGFIPGSTEMLVTVPAAILVAGAFAALIGALSLRTAGVQFIMITLAFAQMIYIFFASLKYYGGDDGLIMRRRNSLPFLDARDDTTFYFVVLVLLALFVFLCLRFTGSRFGLLLGGVRQSERRLAAIGISTFNYKLVAFIIAGMGAGLAGALMANQARFVSPEMLHWTKSGELMIMVILGGAGTIFGPIIGAIVMIGLDEFLGQIPGLGEHKLVIIGPILILIVLFARRGLFGLFSRKDNDGGGGHG